MRFRRALDRDVAEGLSAASEPQLVGVAEALELALLLAGGDAARYERTSCAGTRFAQEAPNVDLREARRSSLPPSPLAGTPLVGARPMLRGS